MVLLTCFGLGLTHAHATWYGSQCSIQSTGCSVYWMKVQSRPSLGTSVTNYGGPHGNGATIGGDVSQSDLDNGAGGTWYFYQDSGRTILVGSAGINIGIAPYPTASFNAGNCSAQLWTNYTACLGVTNTSPVQEFFQLTVAFGGGGTTNPWPVQPFFPGESRIFCFTNSQPFTLIAAGTQEDYYSTTGQPNSGTNQVPNGSGSSNTNYANYPESPTPPNLTNGPPATTTGQEAIVEAVERSGGQTSRDLKNVQSGVSNVTWILSGGNGPITVTVTNLPSLVDTNSAREVTQQGTTNMLRQIYNWLTNLSYGTNVFAGVNSNLESSGGSASNQLYTTLSTNQDHVAGFSTWTPPTTEQDRGGWIVKYRKMADGPAYADWTGTIDCNPLHGKAAQLFPWVKYSLKFCIIFTLFFFLFNDILACFRAFNITPGGGFSAASNTPWASGIWVTRMALYVVLLALFVTVAISLLAFALGASGGWLQHPFTSTAIALAGDSATFVRAACEVLDAIIPVTFIGVCLGAYFLFRLSLDGLLMYAQTITKGLIG